VQLYPTFPVCLLGAYLSPRDKVTDLNMYVCWVNDLFKFFGNSVYNLLNERPLLALLLFGNLSTPAAVPVVELNEKSVWL
jgi:hypothetical protein